MRLPHLSPAVVLVLASAAVACVPADEEPAPVTAQAQVPPPPPAAPAQTSDESGEVGGVQGGVPDPKYTSPEVHVGEETDVYDDNDPAALSDFRGALDPYGTWADDPTYGTIWTPSPNVVGPDFQPYVTAGHWTYDNDYVWASDYDWGWAPFHYGRWVYIDGHGWAWVPGREYRGSWVGWGADDGYGYVGWYPLAPAFFWFGGVAVGYGFAIGPRWSYCPRGAVFEPRLAGRMVVGPAVASVGASVRPIGGPGTMGHGPEPSRLGFSAAQVPHPTGAAAAGIARAQQFSRPSTAASLGAHAATHVAPAAAAMPHGGPEHAGIERGGATSRPGLTTNGENPAMRGAAPGAHAAPTQQPAQQRKKPASQPAPHPSHSSHGGGHHR